MLRQIESFDLTIKNKNAFLFSIDCDFMIFMQEKYAHASKENIKQIIIIEE